MMKTFSRFRVSSVAGLLVGIAAALLPVLTSEANVSLRNGNFFMSYTDIAYPGGFDLRIDRVYNSKTAFNGSFGWGWGNELEVFLVVSADGSVVVNEYGGGAQNRFNPSNFSAAELDAAIGQITEAARKVGIIPNADQVASYKARLRNDAQFRTDEWTRFVSQGKLQARKLASGTKLTSNRFSYQWISVTPTGYQRVSDSGKVEFFDPTGRLVRVQDKAGNFIQMTYGKEGTWEKLIDNANRKMFFSYNKHKKVIKIQAESGKTVEYTYNDLDELTSARDEAGNLYKYSYSTDKRHNLVRIDYADKTNMLISYFGRDKLENTKSVKDKDGTLTEYEYENVGVNRDSLKVAVKVKAADGSLITQSKYDYAFRRKASGEEWTYRLGSEIDGIRTDTTYNECCGLPIIIKRGTEETTFAYDPKGRLLKKASPNEVTELKYDERAGKVARVAKYPKSKKGKTEWSEFKYDAKANLVLAKDSLGRGVQLLYDGQNRIKSMVDYKKRRLDFTYNELSKPVEIRDPRLGSVVVAYNNAGDVASVDSKGGREIAAQVTGGFQNLLELIRPAGVSLGF